MSKNSELQKKTEKELADLLEEKQKSFWDFRFGVSGSKVRNVREGRALRHDIARILTIRSAQKKKVSQAK